VDSAPVNRLSEAHMACTESSHIYVHVGPSFFVFKNSSCSRGLYIHVYLYGDPG
jgi:hypothetical protein